MFVICKRIDNSGSRSWGNWDSVGSGGRVCPAPKSHVRQRVTSAVLCQQEHRETGRSKTGSERQTTEITPWEREIPSATSYSLAKKGPAPQSPSSKSDYGVVTFSSSAGFLPFGIHGLCARSPSKQQLLQESQHSLSKEDLLPLLGRPLLGSVLILSPSPKSFLCLR